MSKRVNNKKGRIRKRVQHPTKVRGGTHFGSRESYQQWYEAVTRERRQQDAAARRAMYRY